MSSGCSLFLEAWIQTARGVYGEQPYPHRFALDAAATERGSPTALQRLVDEGVSYVLIDRTHGHGVREPVGASRLVFANRALYVYRLLRPKRTGRRASCGS